MSTAVDDADEVVKMNALHGFDLGRPLPIARYAPQCDCWRPGHFHVMPRMNRLRIVTWNILFDECRWQARLDLVLDEFARLRPDLIALQEVTPPQLSRILCRDWVRTHYATSDADGATVEPHGVLLLSRPAVLDARLVALPSQRERKLLLAEVETACGPLRCAVVHLESGGDEVQARVRQLEIVTASLPGAMPALILGDLNFDAETDAEESRLPKDLVDCWRKLRPAEAGKTQDPSANALRAKLIGQSRKHRRAMRCDRVLLRPGTPGRWRPIDITRIGTASVNRVADAFGSDHFGLVATLGCFPREDGRDDAARRFAPARG